MATFKNYKANKKGKIINIKSGRILKPGFRSDYLFVVLSNKTCAGHIWRYEK